MDQPVPRIEPNVSMGAGITFAVTFIKKWFETRSDIFFIKANLLGEWSPAHEKDLSSTKAPLGSPLTFKNISFHHSQ